METVITTTTWYKDSNEIRAKLAFKTAEEAKKHGFALVVVDGGSPESFCRGMRERGAKVIPQEVKGFGEGIRESFREASLLVGVDGMIIRMEPEKYPFVPELPALVSLMMEGEVDLMVLGRKNLDSYPPEQKHEEMFLNLSAQSLTGLKWDFSFGPFIANSQALPYFLSYDGEYGDIWDSIWLPRLRLMADGARVKYLEVDYIHPIEQTKEETGNSNFVMKRLRQLNNMIPAYEKETQRLSCLK